MKGNEIVTRISTESLFKVLCEVSESFPARSAKLSILLANEDKQTCSIIMDEIRLLIDYDQAGLLSSTSKKPTNRRHGKQPRGHIVCRRNKKPLKGYKCGTIEMYVSIPDGKQQVRACIPFLLIVRKTFVNKSHMRPGIFHILLVQEFTVLFCSFCLKSVMADVITCMPRKWMGIIFFFNFCCFEQFLRFCYMIRNMLLTIINCFIKYLFRSIRYLICKPFVGILMIIIDIC